MTDILTSLPQAMLAISHDPHFRRDVHTREVLLRADRIEEGEHAARLHQGQQLAGG